MFHCERIAITCTATGKSLETVLWILSASLLKAGVYWKNQSAIEFLATLQGTSPAGAELATA